MHFEKHKNAFAILIRTKVHHIEYYRTNHILLFFQYTVRKKSKKRVKGMRAARDIILSLPPDIKKQLVFWAPRLIAGVFT